MKWFSGLVILFFLMNVPAGMAQDKADPDPKNEIKEDARLLADDAKHVWQDVKKAGKDFGKNIIPYTKKAMQETKRIAANVKKEFKK